MWRTAPRSAASMVSALRRGDTAALKQHMGEMASSLGNDISGLRAQPQLAAGTEADSSRGPSTCASSDGVRRWCSGSIRPGYSRYPTQYRSAAAISIGRCPSRSTTAATSCSTTSSARSRVTSPRCRHRSLPPPSPAVRRARCCRASSITSRRQHGHLRRVGHQPRREGVQDLRPARRRRLQDHRRDGHLARRTRIAAAASSGWASPRACCGLARTSCRPP